MKEHPILFSGPMVQAILSGQKTVTRRPLAAFHYPALTDPECPEDGWFAVAQRHRRYGFGVSASTEQQCADALVAAGVCPYGKPGNRLWVRESLGYDCEYGHYFAAGGVHGETVYLCSLFDDEEAQTGYSYDGLLPERSVPSIHLHRRYSRILLEVTAVRVERLQDISDEQCLAEGLPLNHSAIGVKCTIPQGETIPRVLFKELWIGTGGDWNANPWVWVVEFRRIQP